jgi:hypothetical protein
MRRCTEHVLAVWLSGVEDQLARERPCICIALGQHVHSCAGVFEVCNSMLRKHAAYATCCLSTPYGCCSSRLRHHAAAAVLVMWSLGSRVRAVQLVPLPVFCKQKYYRIILVCCVQ